MTMTPEQKLAWHHMLAAWGCGQMHSARERSKVGCMLITPNGKRVYGANRFPSDLRSADVDPESVRGSFYIEHAERDMLSNLGTDNPTGGCVYIPWFPCADCARALIVKKIKTIYVVPYNDKDCQKWGFDIVEDMLNDGGVKVVFVDEPGPWTAAKGGN